MISLSGMKKENANTFSWKIKYLTDDDPAQAVQTVQCGGYCWKLEINVQQDYKVACPSRYDPDYGYVNTGNELVKDVYIVYLRKQYDLLNSTASAASMPFDSCKLSILKSNEVHWSKEMVFCGPSSSSVSGKIVLIDAKTIDAIRNNYQSPWIFRLSFTSKGIGTESKIVEKTKQTFVYEDTRKVLKAVETLLQDSDDYDATLVVKGKTFKVHQCILKARVPVFKSMFQADMKERKTGRVVITDCDPVAFEIFLKYIYTGKLDLLTEKNAAPLYYIADKYNVQEVYQFCVQFMMSHWVVGCFFDYINIACNSARNEDPDLFDTFYKSGILFLAQNFDKVTSSPEWMAYLRKNPVGANELVRKAYQCLVYCA